MHVLDQLVDKTTEVVKVQMSVKQQSVYDGVLYAYAERKRRIALEQEEQES